MDSQRNAHLRQLAGQTALGFAGIGAITAACFPLHLDFAIVGCLYLLLVVLLSANSLFAACAIVSVVAVACLDFFFVPPLLSLQIDQPAYGLALLTYLVTALVITRLASRARQSANHAEARREDLARLYELAARLVSVRPEVAVRREYLPIFRAVFGLRAVCLFDAASSSGVCDGGSEHDLAGLSRDAYVAGRDYTDRDNGITIRCLRALGRPVGAIGFEGLRDADTMAGSLTVLATAMMERAEYFQRASEAAAATQVEVLRSAVLDAFAHQFKTPLAAILTAAGSLREIGPLIPEQDEMVDAIETQASGLGVLTTRLLRMARLDQSEIRPKMQIADLSALVMRAAHPYRDSSHDRALQVALPERPVAVNCDPEMLGLAAVQLLENAFRYSPAGSTVSVEVGSDGAAAVLRVSNDGESIPPEERTRIFDRFYRGRTGNHAQGTGLGLYVARKIVSAHGGTLDLDPKTGGSSAVTFYLKLPVRKEGYGYERSAAQSTNCR